MHESHILLKRKWVQKLWIGKMHYDAKWQYWEKYFE